MLSTSENPWDLVGLRFFCLFWLFYFQCLLNIGWGFFLFYAEPFFQYGALVTASDKQAFSCFHVYACEFWLLSSDYVKNKTTFFYLDRTSKHCGLKQLIKS